MAKGAGDTFWDIDLAGGHAGGREEGTGLLPTSGRGYRSPSWLGGVGVGHREGLSTPWSSHHEGPGGLGQNSPRAQSRGIAWAGVSLCYPGVSLCWAGVPLCCPGPQPLHRTAPKDKPLPCHQARATWTNICPSKVAIWEEVSFIPAEQQGAAAWPSSGCFDL